MAVTHWHLVEETKGTRKNRENSFETTLGRKQKRVLICQKPDARYCRQKEARRHKNRWRQGAENSINVAYKGPLPHHILSQFHSLRMSTVLLVTQTHYDYSNGRRMHWAACSPYTSNFNNNNSRVQTIKYIINNNYRICNLINLKNFTY